MDAPGRPLTKSSASDAVGSAADRRVIPRAAASQSVGAVTPRRHCGYTTFPRKSASFASTNGPFLMASMPVERPPPMASDLVKTSCGMSPAASTPTLEKMAFTSSSLRFLTPREAHAARNCAWVHFPGCAGPPAWATNAAATTSISFLCCSRRFPTASRIFFMADSQAHAASGLTGSATAAPSVDLDGFLGLNLPPGSPCRLLSHIGGLCLCFLSSGRPCGRRGGSVVVNNGMGAGTGFARSVRVSSTHLAHPLAHGWRGQASTRGSADGTHALPSVAMSSCGGW